MPADELIKGSLEPVQPPQAGEGGPAPASAANDSKRRIAAEHRALREILARVERTPDLRTLLPLLEELQVMLTQHFAEEESPQGLHEAIGESALEKTASLERLFCEHQHFLEVLARLIRSTRECLEGPVEEVLSGVADLTWRLHLHEESENELFVDVVSRDLGGSE